MKRPKGDIGPIRAVEVARVIEDRYGGLPLPDDDAATEDLDLLLPFLVHLKDGPVRARKYLALAAPWMTPDRVQAVMEWAARTWVFWDADELAARLNLTYAQRKRLRIRTIGATDADKEERRRLRKEEHAARQRARRREEKQAAAERRGKVMQCPDLSLRARELFALLSQTDFVKVSDVTERWTDGSVENLKNAKSRHMAVARAADELKAAGLLEEEMKRAPNGVPVRLIKRIRDGALSAAHGKSVVTTWRQATAKPKNQGGNLTSTGMEKASEVASTYYGDKGRVHSAPNHGDKNSVRSANAEPCAAMNTSCRARFGLDVQSDAGAALGPPVDDTTLMPEPMKSLHELIEAARLLADDPQQAV